MTPLLVSPQEAEAQPATPKLSLQTKPQFIAVMNLKGGVGKTTTAVHLAQFLSQFGETILVDGDPNRSAIAWSKRTKGTTEPAFVTISETLLTKYSGRSCYYIIDTQARPLEDDMKDLLEISDLIILPTPPLEDDMRVTVGTAKQLQKLGSSKHCVLLTKVRNDRGTPALVLGAQQFIRQEGIPILDAYIRLYDIYSRAFGQGIPVSQMRANKADDAWSDYQSAMSEVFDEPI